MSKKLKLKIPKEIINEPFVVSDENEPQKEVVRKRCPRGTRKNKNGDCVPTEKKNKPAPSPEIPPKISSARLTNQPILDELRRQLPVFHLSTEPPKSPRVSPVKEPEVLPPAPDKKTNMPVLPPTTNTQLNELLKKRERTDYVRNQKEGFSPHAKYSFLYPELDDPFFNVKIASKKEFHDTQYDGTVHDIEARANEMCNAKFELLPHQLFVKNFLSFQTPYNSLLLYHSLGSGKTCSAISIAEEMRKYMKQVGIKEKILIVASPNLQGNFRRQLFDETALQQIVNPNNPNEYTWNIESCVGNSLLKEITPGLLNNMPREKIISNIQSIINQYYEFMGYGQLANFIHSILNIDAAGLGLTEKEVRAQEIRAIRRVFNNRLVIIDEVHNIRLTEENKANSPVSALLMKVAKYSNNMRLLLLSATPMFNSYEEIVWLINLMNLNDKRSTVQLRDIFDVKGEFKPKTNQREESGEECLIRKLTGYVSYVRGENPYIFPFRIYPKHFSPEHSLSQMVYPETQMNGKPVEEPLKHVNVYVHPMKTSTYQSRAYRFLMEYLRRKEYDVYSKATGELIRNMPSFENMDTFGYTLLQMPLEMLNIVYPSPSVEQWLQKYERGVPEDVFAEPETIRDVVAMSVGEKGLNQIMTYETLTKPNMIKCNYEYRPEILEKYGRVFSPEQLPKYSHKIANICDTIRKSKGIVILYSQFIDGGVIPMSLALEEMGFARFGSASYTQSLFKTPPTEPVDALTGLTRREMGTSAAAAFHPAKYVIISGDKYFSPNNKQEMKYITASDNADGSKIRVVLITRSGSEGLDFKNIRQVHILEPWYNMNRMEQIIGRAVRNMSHCRLPFSQRNVQIYMHATRMEIDNTDISLGNRENTEIETENAVLEEPADLYVYRVAEKKALQIGKITRILKETAVDCILNVGQSNFTAEKLETVERNRNIQQDLSTGETIKYRVGDQPFTDICDYMASCEFQCRNYTSLSPEQIQTSTYNTEYAHSNYQYISNRIRQLYREQSSYSREQLIKMINYRKTFPLEQIFFVLTDFIDNKHSLVDAYQRYGYLVNRDLYYLFQPIEITDEQASVFDRSVPVDYRREKLILEVPKSVSAFEQEVEPPKSPEEEQKEVHFEEKTKEEMAEEAPKEGTLPAKYRTIIQTLLEQKRETETKSVLKKTTDWYKHFHTVLSHLQSVYGFTATEIQKYVLHHALDMLMTEDRLVLLNYLYGPEGENTYIVSPALETEVKHYFQQKIMTNTRQNKIGIFIPNGEAIELWIRSMDGSSPEWVLGETYDYNLFVDDLGKYNVPTSQINEMIGFVIDFKKKEMVYKVKDLRQKRNNNGARIDSAGKTDIIKILNQVVGEERYTAENTDKEFSKIGLCIVLELVLRQYTDKKVRGKIYHLTPEQSLIKNIARM